MKPTIQILILITILAGIVLIGYIYNDLASRGVFDRSTPVTVKRDTIMMPPVTINLPPSNGIVIERPIPINVDSAAIARAFFSEVYYNDSVVTDTVTIHLRESVSRNAIQSRELTYKLNIPIQTITEYRQELNRSIVFGGGGAFHGDKVNVFLSGGYQNRKGSVLFGQIGTDGSVRVGWMGRVVR